MEFTKELSRLICHIISMYMPVLRTRRIYKKNFGKNLNLKSPVNIYEKAEKF